MKKTNIEKIIALIAILVFGFSLSGCQEMPFAGWAEFQNDGKFEILQFTMNAGDTYKFDVEQFRDYGIDYDKYQITSSNENAITVKKNVITAVDNGFSAIRLYLYTKGIDSYGKKGYFVYEIRCVNVYVVNESAMTPITTTQELADIGNNLRGNYILKADIDLAGIEWRPIGSGMKPNLFTGMLINPYGFVIKNLTTDGGGLFVGLASAYVDGIILEKSRVGYGGIAVGMRDSVIVNCKNEGEIYAESVAGGIVGFLESGTIMNCEFNGIIKVQGDYQIDKDNDYYRTNIGAGGITGFCWVFLDDTSIRFTQGIFNCKVNADIISTNYAGGIVGYNFGNSKPTNCTFIGDLNGEIGQGDMYGYCRW